MNKAGAHTYAALIDKAPTRGFTDLFETRNVFKLFLNFFDSR